MRGVFSVAVIGLLASLAAACASNPSATAPAPAMTVAAADPATPAPATAPAPAAAPAAPVKTANKFDPDEVVCRYIDVTGSRVRKQQVCKTRREWEEGSRQAQEFMRDNERRNSTGTGGTVLSPGD